MLSRALRPWRVGTVVGAAAGLGVGLLARTPTLVSWPDPVRRAYPVGAGVTVGAITGLKVWWITRALADRKPPLPSTKQVAVGLGVVGVATVAGRIAHRKFIDSLLASSRQLEPAFAGPPELSGMSGSVQSSVRVQDLGREGARYVHTSVTDAAVAEVMGEGLEHEPIRVFVGLDSADSIEERVALAMSELRRTNAFNRSVLLVQAPAGSGYANPTPADILEIVTRGDCASVAVAYGLLPSFLSLNRVDIAARTQALLLQAIANELVQRDVKPRVLLYGESLGARVQQQAVAAGPLDLDVFGVDAALWVGTPGGTASDVMHALCAGESIILDSPRDLPSPRPQPRPRTWFLEHDGDPVVRFRSELVLNRPDWLPHDGERGRNVPRTMEWHPGLTWSQVLVDVIYATKIKPGDFQSLGHDYRADLGPVVAAAYGYTLTEEELERLDRVLRELEVRRAAMIEAPGA
ncbi:MAG: hypothetical protein RJB01_1309 [Actinomycetota bacterium]|jgi:uncharacterized membrane protein